MSYFSIEGGRSLYGEVKISPAKNSVLPLMCSAILVGELFIENCPKIGDVLVMCEILNKIGGTVKWQDGGLYINTENVHSTVLPEEETKKIRASFFLVGAMLKRFGTVTVTKPGGCNIGSRGLDIHIDGLKSLGAKVLETENEYIFSAERLQGRTFNLRYPSVGATENLIMASVTALGETILKNCAKEPEVKDLCDFLNLCGGKIYGAGTNTLRIQGVKKLKGKVSYLPLPDRIEAGTFLLLFMLVGGEGEISFVGKKNIYLLMKKILDNACNKDGFCVNIYREKIYICANGFPEGLGKIVTSPYPGVPTDLHPLISAYASSAKGITTIEENVFDCRFAYLDGLKKFGAKFTKKGNVVTFNGTKLHGAEVYAPDLRGGAGLVLVGLKAEGKSKVFNGDVIMRGYDDFAVKLQKIGANIKFAKE